VLVVDDEDVVRRMAQTALERFGYAVAVAENGKEAVEMFRARTNEIALVLLDMTMPVMGGERMLKTIRPDVKVILSSGYNEVEAIQRFSGKGLAGLLQKPYTATALLGKIRQVLQN
jgi:CheY-like chemotaxis protein